MKSAVFDVFGFCIPLGTETKAFSRIITTACTLRKIFLLVLHKRVMRYSNLPQGTLPKAMDIKELTPEHKKGGCKYILYMTDEFSKYTKAVLIQDKEANTVISAVYTQWIIGTNGLGHGTPRLHNTHIQ